jgi:16S rRNA pseudouridine516 synthase
MSRKADRKDSLRLDKLLAREGLGTRSELGKAVRRGRVCVNGVIEKDPGCRISAEDEILFDGKPVRQRTCVYYMLNKPAGVLSATEDSRERTVLDLLRDPSDEAQQVLRRGLFPVGRLDKDTEGLLLITDDGQLAHRLLAPGKHVDKTYYAVVTGRVTEEDIRAFAEGLTVDGDFTAMPAQLRPAAEADSTLAALIPENIQTEISPEITDSSQILVTIREGKYHQIKRMFASRQKEVLYLKRLSMGPLFLDPSLLPGQFRPLTGEEIDIIGGHPDARFFHSS